MIHNHVTELRNLLIFYAPSIWPILKDNARDTDLSTKIKIVGDYPQLQLLKQLRDYNVDMPLRAILSLIDTGTVIHRTVHMGTYKSDNTIRVGVDLLTADPELREELGGDLIEFIGKNMARFKGKRSPWRLDNVTSGGIMAPAPDLYGRTYNMFLKEIS